MRKIATVTAALLLAGTFATPAAPAPGPWVVSFPTETSWSRVTMFDDGSAYVVLNPFSGILVLLKSTDHGVTWKQQSVPGNGDLRDVVLSDVAMATRTRGFAKDRPWGPANIYRTDDGGATWRTVSTELPPPRGYTRFAHWRMDAAPGGNTVAYFDYPYRRTPACPDGEWPKANMTVSRDAGRTWTRTPLPYYAGWLFDMDWYDGSTGAIAVDEWNVTKQGACWTESSANGARYTVWTTRDAGRTWRRSAIRCALQCATVTWASSRRIVATGFHGEVYASDDAGRTAREIGRIGSLVPDTETYPTHPWDVSFALDGRTGYAVTHHSETYRTTDGGQTWTLDDVQEVYPDAWYRSVATFDGMRAIAVTPFGVRARLSTVSQR